MGSAWKRGSNFWTNLDSLYRIIKWIRSIMVRRREDRCGIRIMIERRRGSTSFKSWSKCSRVAEDDLVFKLPSPSAWTTSKKYHSKAPSLNPKIERKIKSPAQIPSQVQVLHQTPPAAKDPRGAKDVRCSNARKQQHFQQDRRAAGSWSRRCLSRKRRSHKPMTNSHGSMQQWIPNHRWYQSLSRKRRYRKWRKTNSPSSNNSGRSTSAIITWRRNRSTRRWKNSEWRCTAKLSKSGLMTARIETYQ